MLHKKSHSNAYLHGDNSAKQRRSWSSMGVEQKKDDYWRSLQIFFASALTIYLFEAATLPCLGVRTIDRIRPAALQPVCFFDTTWIVRQTSTLRRCSDAIGAGTLHAGTLRRPSTPPYLCELQCRRPPFRGFIVRFQSWNIFLLKFKFVSKSFLSFSLN